MLQYTSSGGENASSLVIVTVDSPKFILAVEPLAALLEFAIAPFKKSTPEQGTIEANQVTEIEEGPAATSGSMAIRLNIVHATVTVIADDSDPRSQAIQLSIKEILLSQQGVMALKVDQLGMSFGRMDRPDERVRFLDDLNVALSLDTRRRGSQQMTSFEVEIPDPIIFRASYTDIMLITDIVNKAIAVASSTFSPSTPEAPQPKSLHTDGLTDVTSLPVQPAAQSVRRSSVSRRRKSIDKASVLISKEQLKANINGFQLVLVGDLVEMPMVHLTASEFAVTVNDWTGDVSLACEMR